MYCKKVLASYSDAYMRILTLTRSFFDRPADKVACDLLGCFLCVAGEDGTTRHMITETEAYMGPHDLACHAAKGRTKRTEVLFAAPGTIYVYLIYGIYDMFNIVTGKKGYPAAVLIRGVEGVSGPGRVTKRLHLDRNLNGMELGKDSGVWIESRGADFEAAIMRTPRIGVAYAGQWAHADLRFLMRPASDAL